MVSKQCVASRLAGDLGPASASYGGGTARKRLECGPPKHGAQGGDSPQLDLG